MAPVGQEISADPEARVDGLREHLVVEHEILGAKLDRKAFEDPPAPCAIARMVLGKVLANQEIFGSVSSRLKTYLPNRAFRPPTRRGREIRRTGTTSYWSDAIMDAIAVNSFGVY